MTKAVPFTQASLRRAILAAEAAGKHVIGIRSDGTLILGDHAIDTEKFGPAKDDSDLAKWQKVRA
jgi:hypothetical protein